MNFIEKQMEMLKDAVDNGIVSKDSPLLLEQKERIIDLVFTINAGLGITIDKSCLGAIVDKLFADKLGVE